MTSGYSIPLIRDQARSMIQLYLLVGWTSAFKQFFVSQSFIQNRHLWPRLLHNNYLYHCKISTPYILICNQTSVDDLANFFRWAVMAYRYKPSSFFFLFFSLFLFLPNLNIVLISTEWKRRVLNFKYNYSSSCFFVTTIL